MNAIAFRLILDYDFNCPPDEDGYYRVLLPAFLVGAPAIGDEILFGDRADETMTRGVVRDIEASAFSSRHFAVVERLEDVGARS